MTWVIKEWRLEAFADALLDRARESAEDILGTAERDARRARRVARREAVDAGEQLRELERMATELALVVRRQREDARARRPAAPERSGRQTDATVARAIAEAVEAAPAANAPGVEPEPAAIVPEADSEAPAPAAAAEREGERGRRRRPARASLRTRAVAELFQPTEPAPART